MHKVIIFAVSILALSFNAFAQPDTLWTKTFGGSGYDEGNEVQQTTDGGYIISGGTYPDGSGYRDVYLIKTDANGDSVWTKTFGESFEDYGSSVQQTNDGGYIIAGRIGSDVWLIKTDANGDSVWTKTIGGSGGDGGESVKQTTDGGYIIAGSTTSYGAGFNDAWLIKTDANGDSVWTNTFGGGENDYGYSVQQTSDSGYIIAGYIKSTGTRYSDVWLIKTDANGDSIWTRTFGGSEPDAGYSVQQTTDGGYIITGYTYSYGADGPDVYIIKTDANGNESWSQTFGGSDVDRGYSVQQTTDGGYVIAGYTESFGAGGKDVYLIRLAAETGVIELDHPQPLTYSLLPAYPNPFNPSTLIRFEVPVAGEVQIKVYDLQGNVVATLTNGWQTPGLYQVPFDAAGYSSGIYLTRLTTGDFTQTQKLVLIK